MKKQHDDEPEEKGVLGFLERAREARAEREKQLGSIFGDAKAKVDKRAEAINSLFRTEEEAEEEPNPLTDSLRDSLSQRESRRKQDSQLFEAERARREQNQKELTKSLFGRLPEPPPEEPPPPKGRKKK